MRVVVCVHAAEQAADRAGLTVADVEREVSAAVEAGRVSDRAPAWLDGRARRPRAGRSFAWTEDRRCYVVSLGRSVAVVITMLTPLPKGSLGPGPTALAQAFERAGVAA